MNEWACAAAEFRHQFRLFKREKKEKRAAFASLVSFLLTNQFNLMRANLRNEWNEWIKLAAAFLSSLLALFGIWIDTEIQIAAFHSSSLSLIMKELERRRDWLPLEEKWNSVSFHFPYSREIEWVMQAGGGMWKWNN